MNIALTISFLMMWRFPLLGAQKGVKVSRGKLKIIDSERIVKAIAVRSGFERIFRSVDWFASRRIREGGWISARSGSSGPLRCLVACRSPIKDAAEYLDAFFEINSKGRNGGAF